MSVENKWSKEEYLSWIQTQKKQRSYENDIVSKIKNLSVHFDLKVYGELNYFETSYPLYTIESKRNSAHKPNILITGGVHGYETSGALGAISFMKNKAKRFEEHFNFICAPCISPWAYETINRWNPDALDPNRNFFIGSPAKECSLLLNKLKDSGLEFLAHFDLHETTDTDNTIFRPLLEKRDGIKQEIWDIPDGFYVVGDTSRIETDFQNAIIKKVSKVTHIAPRDAHGKIIGVNCSNNGIINYDVKSLHLCTGITSARYVTTTEVYPNSPQINDIQCINAQVESIVGGVEFLLKLT